MLIEKTCGNDISLEEHSDNDTNDANNNDDEVKTICESLGYKKCTGCIKKPPTAVIKISRRRNNVIRRRGRDSNNEEIIFVKPPKPRPPQRTFQSILQEEMSVDTDFESRGFFIDSNLQRLYEEDKDFDSMYFEQVWYETHIDCNQMNQSMFYDSSSYAQVPNNVEPACQLPPPPPPPPLVDVNQDLSSSLPIYNVPLSGVQEAMISEWINQILPGPNNIPTPAVDQARVVDHQRDDLNANAVFLENYLDGVDNSNEAVGEAAWSNANQITSNEISLPIGNVIVPNVNYAEVVPMQQDYQDPNQTYNFNDNNNNNAEDNINMNGNGANFSYDAFVGANDEHKSENFSNENDYSNHSNLEESFVSDD